MAGKVITATIITFALLAIIGWWAALNRPSS